MLLSALPVDASRAPGVGADRARRRRRRRRGRRLRGGAGRRGGLGGNVDVGERVRSLGVARRPFHDHVVLVELAVDRRHLALAEGVVERRVDRRRGEAEPRRAVAVDVDHRLDAVLLLVGVDVGQHRLALHLVGEAGRPAAQVGEAVALQRVLVVGVALPAAGANVLHGAQEDLQAGDLGELRAQPRDHGLAALAPLGRRLQVGEQEAAAGAAAAGEADDGGHRRVAADDGDDLAQLLAHRLRRDALVGAQAAAQLAGVLLRKEALRRGAEEVDVEADHRDQDEEDEPEAGERPVEARLVPRQHLGEAALGAACQRGAETPRGAARRAAGSAPAGARRRAGLQQPGAHHRRRRQRDDERDQHRRRQRHRELAEQPPDLALHEQERDEHRDQRDADREHGEADLLGAEERRLHAVHPGLDVARRVLEDDDRVVDDEAGRDRDRHQAQVVEREAEQVHHAEGAEQRDDRRHRRDDGRADAAQEQADDDHHEDDRDHAASARSRAARRGSSACCRRRRRARSAPAAGRAARAAARARRRPS